jgi:hypothetical protein
MNFLTLILLSGLLSHPQPKVLTIHGQRWDIVNTPLVSGDSTLWGNTLCEQQIIVIKSTLGPHEWARTLVHESQHAFTCENGKVHNRRWNNKEVEHPGIYFGAQEWTTFIADNPETISYVQWAAKL